jgi:hypothetical protein
MKSLTNLLKESLDIDNIYYKINVYFQKDANQLELFNKLKIDNDIDNDIDNAINNGFDIKTFVDFVYDDIKPSLDKDYIYQLKMILKSIA